MKKNVVIIVLAVWCVLSTLGTLSVSRTSKFYQNLMFIRTEGWEHADNVIYDMWIHYPHEFESLKQERGFRDYEKWCQGDFEDLFYPVNDDDSITREINLSIPPVINNTREVDSLMIDCVVKACDRTADTAEMDWFYASEEGTKFWKLYHDYYE